MTPGPLEDIAFGESGTVECLIISPHPGDHRVVEEILVIPGVGVRGDHADKQFWHGKHIPGREVSAMNAEVLEALGIPPAVPGDNLIIRGVDLRAVQPGMLLRVGGLLLRRSATPHRPCRVFRDRTSDLAFRAVAQGWRGALFEALAQGGIRVGDSVRPVSP